MTLFQLHTLTSESRRSVSLQMSLHGTMRVAMRPMAELKWSSVMVSTLVQNVEKSRLHPIVE